MCYGLDDFRLASIHGHKHNRPTIENLHDYRDSFVVGVGGYWF